MAAYPRSAIRNYGNMIEPANESNSKQKCTMEDVDERGGSCEEC